MLLSELTNKDVINEQDGTKVGRIVDLEIDIESGRIIELKIKGSLNIWRFLQERDIISISYDKIIKVGSDVIIVDTAI